MPTIDYSRFYRYDELNALLEGLCAENPGLMRLESIGPSHEGRPIQVAIISDPATGPDIDKPALWVDGNIHATELSGSNACLFFIEWLLAHRDAPEVRDVLTTRTVYVCPRINPDGAEWALADPPRFVRSSTRRYPHDEDPVEGLVVEDIDGNGRILQMRMADANGPWKIHPDEPRLMVRREPGETGGKFFRLMREGRFVSFDGHNLTIAPNPQGLDLNRNFPAQWRQESEQAGAGPYPVSEPEVRAVVDFIVAHPNIGTAISFHTYSGVLLRPSSHKPDDKMAPEDLWAYQTMGRKAAQITGYPALSIFEDFTYYPGQTLGGSFDWAYEHRGAFMWAVEIWNPRKEAGIDSQDWIGWFRDHPVEDDLKLVALADRIAPGQACVPWHAFSHPQLGPVEIGGFDEALLFRNPPPSLREREVARFPKWLLWQASILPRIELAQVEVERLSDEGDASLWRIGVRVENSGWLPTYVTEVARKAQLARGVLAEFECPTGHDVMPRVRQEAGELDGWSNLPTAMSFFGRASASPDRGFIQWTVRAKEGETAMVTVWHDRAGRARHDFRLEPGLVIKGPGR